MGKSQLATKYAELKDNGQDDEGVSPQALSLEVEKERRRGAQCCKNLPL